MSRQIDLTQPLSQEDLEYLQARDNVVAIERARALSAGAEFAPPAPPPADDDEEDEDRPDVADMTVEELKDELKSLGQPVSGNKEELQQRLVEARAEQE